MDRNAQLAEQIMGPLTGIIIVLIVGLVIALYFYFKFRERQMMIERGLTVEQISELFKSKKNPYTVLKLGVITIFSGIGIGLGVFMDEAGFNEGLIPLFIITFIGVGFVIAFFVSRKFEKEDNLLPTITKSELS